jgi:hypothetical protein
MPYEIIQYVLYGIAAGILLCIALSYERFERTIMDGFTFALFITACLLVAVKIMTTGDIAGPLLEYGLGMLVVFAVLYIAGIASKFQLVGLGSVKLGGAVGLLLGLGAGALALGLWWIMVLIYQMAANWPKDSYIAIKYRGVFWLVAAIAAFATSQLLA